MADGIIFNPLALLEGVAHRHNLIPAQFDGSHDLRIANVTGRFPWHHHPNGDELWFMLRGGLRIDIEGSASVELAPGDVAIIRQGAVHSPIATQEPASVLIVNKTGFQTVMRDEGTLAASGYREQRIDMDSDKVDR